jgi:hypothetical protein
VDRNDVEFAADGDQATISSLELRWEAIYRDLWQWRRFVEHAE